MRTRDRPIHVQEPPTALFPQYPTLIPEEESDPQFVNEPEVKKEASNQKARPQNTEDLTSTFWPVTAARRTHTQQSNEKEQTNKRSHTQNSAEGKDGDNVDQPVDYSFIKGPGDDKSDTPKKLDLDKEAKQFAEGYREKTKLRVAILDDLLNRAKDLARKLEEV